MKFCNKNTWIKRKRKIQSQNTIFKVFKLSKLKVDQLSHSTSSMNLKSTAWMTHIIDWTSQQRKSIKSLKFSFFILKFPLVSITNWTLHLTSCARQAQLRMNNQFSLWLCDYVLRSEPSNWTLQLVITSTITNFSPLVCNFISRCNVV